MGAWTGPQGAVKGHADPGRTTFATAAPMVQDELGTRPALLSSASIGFVAIDGSSARTHEPGTNAASGRPRGGGRQILTRSRPAWCGSHRTLRPGVRAFGRRACGVPTVPVDPPRVHPRAVQAAWSQTGACVMRGDARSAADLPIERGLPFFAARVLKKTRPAHSGRYSVRALAGEPCDAVGPSPRLNRPVGCSTGSAPDPVVRVRDHVPARALRTRVTTQPELSDRGQRLTERSTFSRCS